MTPWTRQEKVSRMLGRDVEFIADFLGDGAYRNDGDRVVGRAEIGQGDQAGDAEFRSAPAPDVGRDFSDDVRNAAVEADQSQHTAGQQGDDDQLTHAGHAAAHGAEPGHEGKIPHAYSDKPRGEQPQRQNGHHVDPGQRCHQNQQVGEYLHPFNGSVRHGGRLHVPAQEHIAGQGQQRGGKHHLHVGPEFVPHGAALRAGGGDRGI